METGQGDTAVTFTSKIRLPQRVDWTPHPDITVYELAIAVPILLLLARGRSYYPEDGIAALPENVRRHFRIHD